MSSYKLLRTTDDLIDDDEFALTQAVPPGLADLDRSGAEVARSFDSLKIDLMLQWVDAGDNPINTTRGSFDVVILRQMTLPEGLGVDVVTDGISLVGQVAYRSFIVSDVAPGDFFAIQLSNMVGSVGATKARLFYREFI